MLELAAATRQAMPPPRFTPALPHNRYEMNFPVHRCYQQPAATAASHSTPVASETPLGGPPKSIFSNGFIGPTLKGMTPSSPYIAASNSRQSQQLPILHLLLLSGQYSTANSGGAASVSVTAIRCLRAS
eukprot:gene14498-20524_t